MTGDNLEVMTARTTRRGRPPAGLSTLSRAAIVDAAVAVIDDDGVDAVSMRTVARRLRVDPKSLYNHVADKGALLDGVVERIISLIRVPEPTGDARADLRAFSLAYRDAALAAHPRAAALVLTRRVESAGSLAPLNAVLSILSRAGYPPAAAVHVLRTLLAFITGTLLREAEAAASFGTNDPATVAARTAALRESGFPAVGDAAPHLAQCDHEHEFRTGLDLILDAFAATTDGGRKG